HGARADPPSFEHLSELACEAFHDLRNFFLKPASPNAPEPRTSMVAGSVASSSKNRAGSKNRICPNQLNYLARQEEGINGMSDSILVKYGKKIPTL
ncbi:MAG: hypothetical protein ACM335_00175, partial [Deltaproteobacteria bacterium]